MFCNYSQFLLPKRQVVGVIQEALTTRKQNRMIGFFVQTGQRL